MELIIIVAVALFLGVAFAFYNRLSDIALKLTFLNAQMKELHKSMAELQGQPPNAATAQTAPTAAEKPATHRETYVPSVSKKPWMRDVDARSKVVKPTPPPVPSTIAAQEAPKEDAKAQAAKRAALASEQASVSEKGAGEEQHKPEKGDTLAQESAEKGAPKSEQKAGSHQSAPPQPKADPVEAWFTGVARSIIDNVRKNWVVWLGALSLAFGGIFFVQYGIENGVLSPAMRISCALAFGVLLIAGSEFFRFRQKEAHVDPFGPLVAAASGGLASLFGATVGAYSLYGLIGPTTTFIGLALVSWLAIGGGLLYGPVLATIGILGAYYSPLLVGGSEPSALLYLYFAMVLATSFAVERLQRWIWLSTLSVLSVFVWVFLMQIQMPEQQLTPLMLAAILALTITVPAFGFPPKSAISCWPLDNAFWDYKKTYPALLSYAVTGLVLLTGLFFAGEDMGLARPMTLMFAGLLVAYVFFLSKAESLDLIGPALLAGFALMMWMPKALAWQSVPDDKLFYLATLAVTITAVTGGSLLRGQTSTRAWFWNWSAVALPGLGAGVYFVYTVLHAPELLSAIGAFGYLFALALQVCVAVYLRKSAHKFEFGTEGSAALAFLLFLPFAYYFFGEITLPMVLMIGAVAVLEISDLFGLSIARKAFFAYLSGMVFFTTQRYIDGFGEAGYGDISLLFLPVLALSAFGWWRGQQRGDESEAVVFETTVWAALSLFFCALLQVFYREQGDMPMYVMHGSYAFVLAIQVSVQLKRMSFSNSFAKLRRGLFHWYWAIAVLNCLVAILANPLARDHVFGYFPIDSLSIAYLYPALALLLATERFWTREAYLQNVTRGLAGVLLVMFVGLEIRAFWQGPVLTAPGVVLEELYSYTVAMLIFSVGLIAFASVKQRKRVGQAGLAFIIITCLKVFFIDMSGLYGLARATSFIGLGLTLVGIAWANKRFLSFDTPVEEDEPELKPQQDQA
ncbi:hypothetical protein PsAD13_05450 [Pseudovibrio sp. Ad13]|uniref:DUF2339 domain-containing protein n=1 Tax=Pseudovibrio sp. Ad13 TaxID=989396 RepID=UPI0007AE44D9|nr:DUF2339 domain-containing protein [Pseudovibrio sp. Ad13]KZK76012.1 hypothetical protein PsAD13_05450 [Pseudovibrio sp. Ad13]